jgi:hypothetical protein
MGVFGIFAHTKQARDWRIVALPLFSFNRLDLSWAVEYHGI